MSNVFNPQWVVPSLEPQFPVAHDAGVILVSKMGLTALDTAGQHQWEYSFAYPMQGRSPVVSIQRQRVICYVNRQLLILDGRTGAPIVEQAISGYGEMAIAEDSIIIAYPNIALTQVSAQILCLDLDGNIQWSQPLSQSPLCSPMLLNQQVFVRDAASIKVLHRETGEWLWSVDPQGIFPPHQLSFHDPVPPNPIVFSCISERHLLVSFGHHYYLLDSIQPQIGLLEKPQTGLFLSTLPKCQSVLWAEESRRSSEQGIVSYQISQVDLQGQSHWQYVTPSKPQQVLGTNDSIYLVLSPEQRYWEKYQGWYQLPCEIQQLSYTGQLLKTWQAPAPIGLVSIAPDSTLYAFSNHQLYALR